MFILFDIGATKMRLAASRDGVTLGEHYIVNTPKVFEEGMQAFQNGVAHLAQGSPVTALVGGIAGPLDKGKTMLVHAPNLPSWNHAPLKAELERRFGVPVMLENDVTLGALGEAHHGAGKGKKIIAYIAIGTGVGAARVVDGHLDVNAEGFEVGHQILNPDGPDCHCGGKGHLEAYISGWSMETRFQKKPYEITNVRIWDECAEWLAYGVNNMIVHWSPDIVLFGGSMMNQIGIPLDRVRVHLKSALKIFTHIPPLEHASLGDSAGLHGALTLLKRHPK